jgi:antitoxin MazE
MIRLESKTVTPEALMVVDLKQKSQVTIPNEVVKRLRLSVGDKLDVVVKDGKIIITPVVVIPKDQMWFYSKEWQDGEKDVDRQVREGKTTKTSTMEDLFDGLGLNDDH